MQCSVLSAVRVFLQQGDIDHLLVNLRVDATMVKEQMHIRWAAETGIVDAIEPVVASYKEVRGLQVRQLCISFTHNVIVRVGVTGHCYANAVSLTLIEGSLFSSFKPKFGISAIFS